MTPSELREAVTRLRDVAFWLRVRAKGIAYQSPSVPVRTMKLLKEAAQSVDDEANALLSEYGEPLPDGVL